MFDAMGQQVRRATLHSTIADRSQAAQRARVALGLWSAAARCSRRRRQRGVTLERSAASSCRDPAWTLRGALVAWREAGRSQRAQPRCNDESLHSRERPGRDPGESTRSEQPARQPAVRCTAGSPLGQRTGADLESRTPCHDASSASGSCGVGRQPLAPQLTNGSCTTIGESVKKLKGPERFFYDTSGYTGCARFGGPAVVDKENRAAERPSGRRATPNRRHAGPSPRAASCAQAKSRRRAPSVP